MHACPSVCVCVCLCEQESVRTCAKHWLTVTRLLFTLYVAVRCIHTNRTAAESKVLTIQHQIITEIVMTIVLSSWTSVCERALIFDPNTINKDHATHKDTPSFWEVLWNTNKVRSVHFSPWLPHWDNRGLSVGVLPDPSCVGQAPVWSKRPAVLTAASAVPFERDSCALPFALSDSKPQNYKSSKDALRTRSSHCKLQIQAPKRRFFSDVLHTLL